jgi:hypothetical protein
MVNSVHVDQGHRSHFLGESRVTRQSHQRSVFSNTNKSIYSQPRTNMKDSNVSKNYQEFIPYGKFKKSF